MHRAVPELDARQRIVRVNAAHKRGLILDVVLVPELRVQVRLVVGLGVNRAVLGVDRRPAALGLHRPEGGLRLGVVDAVVGTVRHLHEAVLQRLRANLDRLEEHVVAPVS